MDLVIGGACLSTTNPLAALAEKTPKGFVGLRDKGDGYQFFYPFGWQEVSIPGQDVVYKDVIEPLESVSVSLIDTDNASISEYGEVKEVCYTLADKVLTAPNQKVELIQAKEDDFEGVKYYNMEFKVTAPNYSRHALAAFTVNNGKFYTLLTGCNERRWKKVGPKLKDMIGSFSTFTIVDA
jgi:photosystem II oxygen-evolving enhancer protein 2